MSRSRNIKPGFFENEYLAELGPYCQLLFAGLWILADREGRLEDRPARIKAKIFPYYDVDVDELLEKLYRGSKHEQFIIRYEVDGEKYIWIPKFKLHQNPHPKEKKSVIPPYEPAKSKIVEFNDEEIKSNLITQTDPVISQTDHAGSSGSSDIPLHPHPTDHTTEGVVFDVVKGDENLQRLDRLRMQLMVRMFPTNDELDAMEKMVKLLPIDMIEAIVKEAHAKYKPKYPGDKIRTFQYFLPFVQNAASLVNSRATPRDTTKIPVAEQTEESAELTKELLSLIPEWMAKEAVNSG